MKLFVVFTAGKTVSAFLSAAIPIVTSLLGSISNSGFQNGPALSPSITSNPIIKIHNTISPNIQQGNNAPDPTNLDHNQISEKTNSYTPTTINEPEAITSNSRGSGHHYPPYNKDPPGSDRYRHDAYNNYPQHSNPDYHQSNMGNDYSPYQSSSEPEYPTRYSDPDYSQYPQGSPAYRPPSYGYGSPNYHTYPPQNSVPQQFHQNPQTSQSSKTVNINM